MVLATTIERSKRGFGRRGFRRRRPWRHRVMAFHRRLRRLPRGVLPGDVLTRDGLPHAMRGLWAGSTAHRQRPEGRDEHHQQQKSSSAAVSRPHLQKEYQQPVSVASTQQSPLPMTVCWRLGTRNCCTISVCTNWRNDCGRQSGSRG